MSHRPPPLHISHTRRPSAAAFSSLTASPVIYEGWVLKKRRKKMQGFARRYFTLYQSGLLVYAFEPGQPIRDHLHLRDAAISTTPGRKDIHIDSSAATFHIKCLSLEDFDNWMASFRKLILSGQEAKRSATPRHTARQASVSLNRSGTLVDEIGTTIAELDKAFEKLVQDSTQLKHTSSSKKVEKHKESKFGLFKRSAPSDSIDIHSEPSSANQGEFRVTAIPDNLVHLHSLVETIKQQHSSLSKELQSSLIHDHFQSSPNALPATVEEGEDAPVSSYKSPLSGRLAMRASVATTLSDSMEWFDADEGFDGPEEFVIPDAGTEPGSRLVAEPNNDSQVSLSDRSSVATDDEEEPEARNSVTLTPRLNKFEAPSVVQYRSQLPSMPPADEGSLFTILKKNVGKDLSTIALPVTFNEPLTLLQRAAEEVEYFHLLDEAAKTQDPVMRISYVAAFAVSSYAHTRYRSGRKGFNPMLAETFEDTRMKFIAEKVRHNPLEIAYHAEGEGWELDALTCGRTKFWGKSLEIIPLGYTKVKIGVDTFVWKKPSSFIRNLVVGTKYFEHCGQMTVENSASDIRCVLDFKQNGYWGPSNVVTGSIQRSSSVVGQLEGKWDDQLCQILDPSHLHVLWKIAPFPKDQQDYYGFTSFGVTLNELTPNLVGKLPPTDSRCRPDVRALEDGLLDLAESEKVRLEQLQRDRRNRGQDSKPRWFVQKGDEWVYAGGYWEKRAQGWKDENIVALW